MDASVLAAMAKWPDVPEVYGWLRLDRRGRWLMRDEILTNPAMVAFIGRNYACDPRGAWFFQNGPQRVFVTLDYTPWILRLIGDERLETHTALAVNAPHQVWIDEDGNLLMQTEHGMGLVHDRDLAALLNVIRDADDNPASEAQVAALMEGRTGPLQLRLCQSRLPIRSTRAAQIAALGGFVPAPQPVSDVSQ